LLDPAQDLYQVSDVQEAVRLSSGIQATVDLLNIGGRSHEMSSLPGAPSLRDTQVLAAEIFGNTCVGNSKCQDEAGSCGGPRLLVRMLKNCASGGACRAAARALLVVCEKHKSNSAQATAEGASTSLLALALRCAPKCPFAKEPVQGANAPSGSEVSNGHLEAVNGDSPHTVASRYPSAPIPGLQHDESTEDTDIRQQIRALLLGTNLSVGIDAKSRVRDGKPLNFDKGISDAEAILGANHSMLDVAECVTPRGTNKHANGRHWFDPSAPTPQEMQRQQEVRSL